MTSMKQILLLVLALNASAGVMMAADVDLVVEATESLAQIGVAYDTLVAEKTTLDAEVDAVRAEYVALNAASEEQLKVLEERATALDLCKAALAEASREKNRVDGEVLKLKPPVKAEEEGGDGEALLAEPVVVEGVGEALAKALAEQEAADKVVNDLTNEIALKEEEVRVLLDGSKKTVSELVGLGEALAKKREAQETFEKAIAASEARKVAAALKAAAEERLAQEALAAKKLEEERLAALLEEAVRANDSDDAELTLEQVALLGKAGKTLNRKYVAKVEADLIAAEEAKAQAKVAALAAAKERNSAGAIDLTKDEAALLEEAGEVLNGAYTAKIAEDARVAAAEAKRVADEARLAEEKAAEEKRVAEEKRLADEADAKRIADEAETKKGKEPVAPVATTPAIDATAKPLPGAPSGSIDKPTEKPVIVDKVEVVVEPTPEKVVEPKTIGGNLKSYFGAEGVSEHQTLCAVGRMVDAIIETGNVALLGHDFITGKDTLILFIKHLSPNSAFTKKFGDAPWFNRLVSVAKFFLIDGGSALIARGKEGRRCIARCAVDGVMSRCRGEADEAETPMLIAGPDAPAVEVAA